LAVMSISQSDRMLVGRSDGTAAGVEASIKAAVAQYGPAPGAAKMLDGELQAAKEALESGRYVVWRNSTSGQDFCARVGSGSRCFCGHHYSSHKYIKPNSPSSVCVDCDCKAFAFVPKRPEEVGDYWLPRRRGFNVHNWRAECRCKHGHDSHATKPPHRCKSCGCSSYQSKWCCLVCDGTWADHETLWETKDERARDGRPVGDAFLPLSHDVDLSELVFAKPRGKKPREPIGAERSVKLMPKHLGGLGMLPSDVPSFAERVVGSAKGTNQQALTAVPRLTSRAARPPYRGMRSSSCAETGRR